MQKPIFMQTPQPASLVNILRNNTLIFHVYTVVSCRKMLSSVSWETMRLVPAKQIHTQSSLKFIDQGKLLLINVHNSRSLLDLLSKVFRPLV